MSKTITIYDGAIEANYVGSFVKMGEAFQVIRPGYDAQGNPRAAWTQFVHDGIPVFEEKVKGPLSAATRTFDRQWDKVIGDDRDLMLRALEACKKEHRAKFRDGRSGVEPAPTVHDTREGATYVA